MPIKVAVSATKAKTTRIITTVVAVLRDPRFKFWGPGGVVANRMDSELDDTKVEQNVIGLHLLCNASI